MAASGCASSTPATSAAKAILTPNPLTVSVTRDATHAATSLIPAAGGGTITATGRDGSSFTLIIPDGALLSDQTVTLTPVASIAAFPVKGSVLATVDLGPAGLSLNKAATLTIQPAASASGKASYAFAYDGTGQDWRPYPFDPKAVALIIPIYHFSGYGGAEGTSADVAQGAAAHEPSTAEKQAEGRLGLAAAECKSSGCLGSTDAKYQAAIERILHDWYLQSVNPGLLTAQKDEGSLQTALDEWGYWWRALLSNGMGVLLSSDLDSARASAITGLQNALVQATNRCIQNNDPFEARKVLRWGTIAVKNGLTGPGLTPDEIDARARACANFELHFDSKVNEKTALGPYVSHWTSVVPLESLTVEKLSGSGPLTGDIQWPNSPDCTFTATANPATLTAVAMHININSGLSDDDLNIELVLNPGYPTAQVTSTCKGHSFTNTVDIFLGAWMVLHVPEMERAKGGFGFVDWTVQRAKVFATKEWQRSSGEASESAKLEIWHTPKPYSAS